MGKDTKFVGMDVHARTISVAVAQGGGEVRSLGTIANEVEAVRKVVKKLGGPKGLKVCYEAGPTGYALYWELVEMGVECEVVAPTLVPMKVGDRVKTDRRDAEKLARCLRARELTAVWVPDGKHEALRDLVRTREMAKEDELRARNRLGKFLLRHGRRAPEGTRMSSKRWVEWAKGQEFGEHAQEEVLVDLVGEVEHERGRVERLEQGIDRAVEGAPEGMKAVIEGLQALKGIAKVSAVTVVAEVGEMGRFERPAQLMSFAGMVSSERSSGEKTKRGAITKCGNAHLRRVTIEAAHAYRYRPGESRELKRRQERVSEEVREIALKAQHRLWEKYWRLSNKGKNKGVVVTAVGRELLGFVWAVGVAVERAQAQRHKRAA